MIETDWFDSCTKSSSSSPWKSHLFTSTNWLGSLISKSIPVKKGKCAKYFIVTVNPLLPVVH